MLSKSISDFLTSPPLPSSQSAQAITAFQPQWATLIDLLEHRSCYQTHQIAYQFLGDGEQVTETLTYGELSAQAKRIARYLQTQSEPGSRVLLLFPSGLDFIQSFFACLYAGMIAVPAYAPTHNHNQGRLDAIVEDAQARIALTTTALKDTIQAKWVASPALAATNLLTIEQALQTTDASLPLQPQVITADTLAFLQYTSGSTGNPKGVMVSHRNILANEHMIQAAFGHDQQAVVVGWLPLFHDMGLIGNVLQPLYLGTPAVLMPPTAFLQKPLRWLQAISRYRATTSGGPNFAYDLCVHKVRPEELNQLDLSCWQVAFNGAEPVRADSLQRFAAKFAPCGFQAQAFYPCYGMAEATLLVSGKVAHQSPLLYRVQADALKHHQVISELTSATTASTATETQTLVGCGAGWQGEQIRIVHPETLKICPTGQVGEIWVAGTNVAQGYWQQPELSQQTFHAYTRDRAEGPFLRTGDLGFWQNGELFVTGRLKDVIIIRGRNYYPHDLEATVQASHPALSPNLGAAFSVDGPGGEQLVLVQEVERSHLRQLDVDQVVKAIQQAVTREHGLQVDALVLIKPATLPKTSSGKVQRRVCRQMYLNHALVAKATWVREQIRDGVVPMELAEDEGQIVRSQSVEAQRDRILTILHTQIAQILRLPALAQIQPEDDIACLGLDSLGSVELRCALLQCLGIDIPLQTLCEVETIGDLVEVVVEGLQAIELDAQEPRETPSAHPALNLYQEAVLAPHIYPDATLMPPSRTPQTLLITGATGFVGVHLLHDLLQHTSATIYCLVRAADSTQARHKLVRQLQQYTLWQAEHLDRVIPVCGDLAQPQFGLTDEAFAHLAKQVDAIYHLGAVVNHLYPYHQLKSTNVLGTQTVLHLATTAKLKPVYFMSSLSILESDPQTQVDELTAPQQIQSPQVMGYAQSKWVAEQLIQVAHARGIPTVCFRTGFILGHSQWGTMNAHDQISLVLKGILQTGQVPEQISLTHVMSPPVDVVCRALVALTLNTESWGKTYHMVYPPMDWNQLVSTIQHLGYPAQRVSLEAWLNHKDASGQPHSPAIAVLRSLYHGTHQTLLTQTPPQIHNQRTLAALAPHGITFPPIDAQLLQTYLHYLQGDAPRTPDDNCITTPILNASV